MKLPEPGSRKVNSTLLSLTGVFPVVWGYKYLYKLDVYLYYGGMNRRQCVVENCQRFGRNKGWYKDAIRYDKYCESHHRLRFNKKPIYYTEKQLINNSECDLCGWNKGPCDRHRHIRENGYTKENVTVLCPNCHRLTHLGIL